MFWRVLQGPESPERHLGTGQPLGMLPPEKAIHMYKRISCGSSERRLAMRVREKSASPQQPTTREGGLGEEHPYFRGLMGSNVQRTNTRYLKYENREKEL